MGASVMVKRRWGQAAEDLWSFTYRKQLSLNWSALRPE
jgi:hypothetical protein